MPRGANTLEDQKKALLKAALKKPLTAQALADRTNLGVTGRGAGRAIGELVREKKLVKTTGTHENGNGKSRSPRYQKRA